MKKIYIVSDVSLGYGNPQIPAFSQEMYSLFNDSEIVVLEPDQPEKKQQSKRYEKYFDLKRIITEEHPYSYDGRIDYINKATKSINDNRPDILVCFTTFTLPVLQHIRYKPEKVIYYNLEMPEFYGQNDIHLNRLIASKVDLLIFPEERRAIDFIGRYNYKNTPSIIVYNSVHETGNSEILNSSMRNGKILYQGTIDSQLTLAGFLVNKETEAYEIDIFGNVSGEHNQHLKTQLLMAPPNIRYLGYVEADVLKNERKKYAYSIVIWNPISNNFLYACPNKLFDSIASGVPPISAPHPQCKEAINKYKCGILMDDWSYESFIKAINYAMGIYGTDAYDKMVENCRIAFEKEYNWNEQMKKVRPYLKEEL